jgi:serine/threonine-protein kinase
MAYGGLLRYEDAVETFQKGLELAPDTPRLLGVLGHVYGVSGQRTRAEEVLARLHQLADRIYISPFDFALVNLGLGRLESFFEWLELAYRSRCYELVSMRVEPKFDSIRADPRFVRMLRRVGLETA